MIYLHHPAARPATTVTGRTWLLLLSARPENGTVVIHLLPLRGMPLLELVIELRSSPLPRFMNIMSMSRFESPVTMLDSVLTDFSPHRLVSHVKIEYVWYI
jgi:hypothetical protein